MVTAVVVMLLGVSLAPWVGERLSGGPGAFGRPSDAQAERLVEERAMRGDDGEFELLLTRSDGSPVRYDPCAPLHVVVNDEAAPEGTDALVQEAVDQVAEATGLVIEVDGTTDLGPDDDERWSGDHAPPVLVVWTDPERESDLDGDTTGVGGSVTSRDGEWFETGTVLLDAPQLQDQLDTRGGRDGVRAVVMHELAHVVGLDHVDDPVELMYPQGRPGVTSFGPGDRRGLALVGSGDCRTY